jgi:hypothetical protein
MDRSCFSYTLFLVSIAFLLTSINCKEAPKPLMMPISNEKDKAVQDTFFLMKNPEFKGVELLKYQYIKYSDSIDKAFQLAYGSGRLSGKYNFDNSNDHLQYSKVGDTIEIRRLNWSLSRTEIYVPDSMVLNGDTLTISERMLFKHHNLRAHGHSKFHERYYKLLVPGKKNLIIKDKYFHNKTIPSGAHLNTSIFCCSE